MGNGKNKNQCRLPWICIVLGAMTGLGILLTVVAPVIVLFIGILCEYRAVVTPSFILGLLFAAIFFIKIQFWTNMMYYPVKRWIGGNIRCVKCGESFTKCERTMEHPKAFVSFVCYCGNCRKAALVETGIFDRALKFKPNRDVERLYEKKYHGEAYKMPIGIWLLFMVTTGASALLLVAVLIGIPTLIYVSCFGPSKELADKFRSVNRDMFYGLLILWNIIYWRSARLRDLVTYPIRGWILSNVKCPKCGDSITKCNVKLPDQFFDFFKYSNSYSVYCKHCKSQRTIQIGGFDFLLRFA